MIYVPGDMPRAHPFAGVLHLEPQLRTHPPEPERQTATLSLAQRVPDAVLTASGRLNQSMTLSPELGDSLNDFLGIRLDRDADGNDTRAYTTFQQMPSELIRPGLFGGAGIDRNGNAFAVVDTGQIEETAIQFGVSPERAVGTIAAQEVLHAATMSHPSLRGRFTTQETEIIGEAYSLRLGGLDYLPFHLKLVANSAQTALQPGSEGYTAFEGIANPAIDAVLARYGTAREGAGDTANFLTRFVAYADRWKIESLLGGRRPTENVAVAFARDELGLDDPEAFAEDLLAALEKAYADCAEGLLAQPVPARNTGCCTVHSGGAGLRPFF